VKGPREISLHTGTNFEYKGACPMVKTFPFIAYHTSVGAMPELSPAPIQREWMSKTRDGFANRCLPLLIANQAGWLVISPHTVRATWTGSNEINCIDIEHLEGPEPWTANDAYWGPRS
jgi:hypothetical protein